MKKCKKIAFVVFMLLAGCILAFSNANVFAEEESSEVLISPTPDTKSYRLVDCISSDVDVLDFGELSEGGRSYTQSFLLSNKCDETLTVSAKVQTYEDSSISNEYKLADEWLNFVGGQSEYNVVPGEDTIVKLRVFLPNSVKGASYYTAVALKLKDSTDAEDVKVVNVRMDVASDGFSRSGNIISNYAQALSFGGAVKAGVKLKNTGTGGFLSKYTLKRGSLFGSSDFETLAEDTKELAAGAEVEFYGGNYTKDQYGIYKIQQSVTYIDGDGNAMESVLEQTVINLPLASVFIAGGALIALISLVIVVKIMKHRKTEEKEDEQEESENEL
jgi:hypothetical protein